MRVILAVVLALALASACSAVPLELDATQAKQAASKFFGNLADNTMTAVNGIAQKINNFHMGPLHASCKLTATFEQSSCADVNQGLVQAIKALSGSDCGTGEKCLYSLTNDSQTELTAIHETPAKHYKDDLTFDFSESTNGGCSVQAKSSSETKYAVLDYGTNYCNLHNLLEQTGLQYTEDVSASHCTQVESADCSKY